jgi:flagellar biosynthesis/type III secretory pathway protein FliH
VQANGQAEASKKVLIKIIKKRIKDNPRRWHEKLSEALWAHRTSKHGATKVTPSELVYGTSKPVEVSLKNLRITRQDYLSAKEYTELMMDKVDEAPKSRLKALEEIEKEMVKIAKAYNKRVVEKLFQVGDLVWKTSGRSSRENDFAIGDSKW